MCIRDSGVGGATGSSKAHKLDSLEHCGAEVQKGNAPIERKLQRLFRREDACKMIKRCNDFGAGGVSVAIGELADGLYIDLNKVDVYKRQALSFPKQKTLFILLRPDRHASGSPSGGADA